MSRKRKLGVQLPLSDATKRYRAAWLKAFRDGIVTVNLPSAEAAMKMRFKMYTATQPIRELVEHNPTMLEAVQGVEVRVRGTQVILEAKRNLPDMQALEAALGGFDVDATEVAGMSDDEKIAQEILASLEKKKETDEELKKAMEDGGETASTEGTRVTHYYTR